MTTVNNLVSSFKSRLQICAKAGGKTIVPFLKNHYYFHPEKNPRRRNEEEIEQASEFLPIITYIHDESESSDPSESE